MGAPICITDGSQVNGNFSGKNVLGHNHNRIVGLAGGIFHAVGGVEIDQSQVDDNQAPNGDGGGIWLGGGTSIVQNGSSVSGNSSGGDGGGIWNRGTLTVVKSTLADNTAMKKGGGIFCDGGKLTLSAVDFDNNSPDNVSR